MISALPAVDAHFVDLRRRDFSVDRIVNHENGNTVLCSHLGNIGV
jgi:hypothetical protein